MVSAVAADGFLTAKPDGEVSRSSHGHPCLPPLTGRPEIDDATLAVNAAAASCGAPEAQPGRGFLD